MEYRARYTKYTIYLLITNLISSKIGNYGINELFRKRKQVQDRIIVVFINNDRNAVFLKVHVGKYEIFCYFYLGQRGVKLNVFISNCRVYIKRRLVGSPPAIVAYKLCAAYTKDRTRYFSK